MTARSEIEAAGPAQGGLPRSEEPFGVQLAAPKPASPVAAVTRELPLAEELGVGHRSPVRVRTAHMLQVGLVIGDADHQASALAQTFRHARKALAQRIARHQSAPQRMAEAAPPAAPSSRIDGTDVSAAVQRSARYASRHERMP